MEIVTLLHSFAPYLNATTLRQMARVITAILTMSGRVTMLGISRWAGKGGSYRTVQRLYNTVLPWALLHWVFFKAELYKPDDVYILINTFANYGEAQALSAGQSHLNRQDFGEVSLIPPGQ